MTDWRHALSELDYGPEEEEAVLEVVRGRWLTAGPRTEAFEAAVAERLGVPAARAVMVNSGTAALHLALVGLGIGPGDEVVVPSLTFVATASAVLHAGAIPVFADITGTAEPNLDPQAFARAITARTRAVIPVHYAGFPARMDEIGDLARSRDIRVIEDAAHALGASLDGRPVGTLGDAAAFSFFSNKNLAVGEGGLLVFGSADAATWARRARNHGLTASTWERFRKGRTSYDVEAVGWNYRPTEMAAALGLVQLGRLDAGNARRAALDARYRTILASAGVEVPFAGRAEGAAHHLLPACLPAGVDRGRVAAALGEEGIQTSHHYPPVHRFRLFRDLTTDRAATLPATEATAGRELTLPLHPGLAEADVDAIALAVVRAVEADR